jgi:hypothetical protein
VFLCGQAFCAFNHKEHAQSHHEFRLVYVCQKNWMFWPFPWSNEAQDTIYEEARLTEYAFIFMCQNKYFQVEFVAFSFLLLAFSFRLLA